jgi:hypothetical protein
MVEGVDAGLILARREETRGIDAVTPRGMRKCAAGHPASTIIPGRGAHAIKIPVLDDPRAQRRNKGPHPPTKP